MNWKQRYQQLESIHPHQTEFHQAVKEIMKWLESFIDQHPNYQNILTRLIEPERIIIFRVPRQDDKGNTHVNRGYRVQFSSTLWPYKGWLRFHPSVNLSILKFLWFEQIFKNALTGLPLWWAKWWADFDPKGKSDNEIMRFCQAFVTELHRHIGEDTDIPAGDIGVWSREIWFMVGMDRKLRNKRTGVFTGKHISVGWSLIRTEATGYGLIYFVNQALLHHGKTLAGKKITISWSGNVAQFAIQKALQLWWIVISASDSDGTVYDVDGFTQEKLDLLMNIKNIKQWRISEYAQAINAQYIPHKSPRHIPCQIALPCATQNELSLEDAKNLTKNGVECVWEGANMPCTPEAIDHFINHQIIYIPGKASNAWWVATSWLEMSQNSMRTSRTAEEVDQKLQQIMKHIHQQCVLHGKQSDGSINYSLGANKAAFIKIADAMISQGIV